MQLFLCHLIIRQAGQACSAGHLNSLSSFISKMAGYPEALSRPLQGITLAEPEVVPFRLTQNLVDAFGVAGVEGVFRRTCEVSLGVRALGGLCCLSASTVLPAWHK